MKVRIGFVSNSSSSSFIVNAFGNPKLPDWTDQYIIFGDIGVTEFGWACRRYDSIWDKINFCYIQARDAKKLDPEEEGFGRQDWLEMLEKVIKKTGIAEIEWCLSRDWRSSNYAYIDHQSSSTEGRNIEMFKSEETLTNFIFNSNSYIQGGNDNV